MSVSKSSLKPALPVSLETQFCNCRGFMETNTNIAKYAAYLKSLYAARNMPVCQKWPPTPSKRYINLALISKDNACLAEAYELTTAKLHGHIDRILKKKTRIEMHQLLGNDGSQKCILIEGAPGVGKSTLAWELCRNWQHLPMLGNFGLVLMIQLREKKVQHASTFEDLLYHRNTSLKQATAKEVEDLEGNNVLLIFDGFDELPCDQRQQGSLFLDIINGFYLPRATVIITSRPSVTAELMTRCKPQITDHVEILGFTEGDIREYAFSVLQHPELVEKFYECVASNPLIYSMMYVPLNSAIVIEIYKQSQGLETPFPQTMTQLYDQLTHALMRRYLIENGLVMDEYQMPKDLRTLPKEVSHQFVELCDVAFNGLCKQKLTWDDLPNDFHHLGFMTKSSSILVEKGPEIHFSFLHLTIQEFVAAVHISYQPSCKQQELYQFYGHLQHFQVVWRFVAGLTKFNSLRWSDVLHRNQAGAPDWLKVDYCIQLPALHCLYEAQDRQICEDFCGSRDVAGFIPDSVSPFDCLVLSYCVSHTLCSWSIDFINAGVNCQGMKLFINGLKARIYSIRELRIGSNQMGLEGVDLLSMMSSTVMEQMYALKLYSCSLNMAAYSRLAEYVTSFSNLEELDLGANPAHEGGMVTLMHQLCHLSKLRLLDVADVAIGSADICALATLVRHCKLKILKIGYHRMALDTITQLLQTVFEPSNLECIDLRNIDLTGVTDVLETLLQHNSNTRELILTWCRLGPALAGSIAKALLVNRSLHSLKIKHPAVGIQPEGCRMLCAMLRANTTLREFTVLDDSLADRAQELISIAQSSPSLTKWQIS